MAKGHSKYYPPAVVVKHQKMMSILNDDRISDFGIDREDVAAAYTELVEKYNTMLGELFRATDVYHQLIDVHGPFYHVEVTEPMSRMESIFKKAAL